MRATLVAVALLGALGACGDDGTPQQPDAATTIDAPARRDAAADAPSMAKCRTVYLNFEAVDLMQGGDDAPTNHSSILVAAQTVPAWRPTDPDRESLIAQIQMQVSARLGTRGYDIVTTRPAAGGYMMIVFGGESQALTGQAGYSSIAPQRCASGLPNGIAFVFASAIDPMGTLPFQEANSAIAMVGILKSIPTSTGNREDCMCISGTCAGWTGGCLVGDANTIRGGGCPGPTTFDEGALFATPACM